MNSSVPTQVPMLALSTFPTDLSPWLNYLKQNETNYTYVYVCVKGAVLSATVCMWRLEDNLLVALSFYYVFTG